MFRFSLFIIILIRCLLLFLLSIVLVWGEEFPFQILFEAFVGFFFFFVTTAFSLGGETYSWTESAANEQDAWLLEEAYSDDNDDGDNED